jgi:hypothetical protein
VIAVRDTRRRKNLILSRKTILRNGKSGRLAVGVVFVSYARTSSAKTAISDRGIARSILALLIFPMCPSAGATAAAKSLTCDIRESVEPQGLQLVAVASAKAIVAGRYTLLVTKQNTAGSSQNLQSGDFQTDGAHEQILTTVILERSALGHYQATLLLDWTDGKLSCSSP